MIVCVCVCVLRSNLDEKIRNRTYMRNVLYIVSISIDLWIYEVIVFYIIFSC